MSEQKLVFVGLFASSISLQELAVATGFLAVEHGKITKKGDKNEFELLEKSGAFSDYKIVHLGANQFLMPGFVDCHTHAPQFPNIGLGLDLPLLEWLAKYTFPLENMYGDMQFAAKVYDQVVQRLLNNGTTTACYFGSIHLEGTLELVKSVIKYHQRALVGKVSMNIKNDAGYYNETGKELVEVETFVKKVLAYENELVAPVITPRFALSCDEELLTGLSKISAKYGCRIQSHISENREEIEYVLKTNPDCKCYGEVYDRSHILNNKCIMAHAVHLTDDEISLLSAKGVSVAHCPASNTRLRSGLCPIRKLLSNNIKVGLGTDVAGGDSASILDAMHRAMDVSMHLELTGEEGPAIEWVEAFYLATLGGAKDMKSVPFFNINSPNRYRTYHGTYFIICEETTLNLDDKIGSFEVNKDFDALLIDVYAKDGPIDYYPTPATSELNIVQRFAYIGDDRNIVQVYVKGNLVKNITSTKV